MTETSDHFRHRLATLSTRLRAAAARAGRSSDEIRLLAATKTVPADVIRTVAELGISDIGENRVQEASEKRPALAGLAVRHHLIGQLQTNKARRAVELFDVIQSIDRLRIAEAVNRAAGEVGKRQSCLIEVKISDDPTKAGVPVREADALIDAVVKLPHVALAGVMAIAPLDADETETRAAFRSAADVFRRHKALFGEKAVLSIGMSDDFELAVEEGSTMIRLGRALFGERTVRA